MKNIWNEFRDLSKIIQKWSTKKKILALLVVWALIFVPSVAFYTSIHRETSFAFYPEESSPMEVQQEDWDVVTSPESEKEIDRYVINVTDGGKVDFKWKAKNYTARVHIGQVNVYYETSWNSSGILRLKRVNEESEGKNETWAGEKTFHQDGEVSYYFRADKSDLPRFFKRASVIIEGGNLYEDVRTGPPPLINFFFIPPTLLAPSLEYGGYFLSFYIYFALFILLDALMMFQLFKEWGEDKAFLSSLLFIANPISFYTLFQDEGIITFTVILSLLLVIKKRKKLGAISIGLGSITKIWAGFLIPAQLFDRDKEFKRRIMHVAISAAVGISVISLFYLLWGPKSLWFISFYGGSASKSTLGGVSIWSTLSATPLISESILDSNILLGFIGIVELGLLYTAYKKHWDILLVFTSTLAFFLIMYPKIHWEYYLMLLPTFLFYAVRDKRIFSIFLGMMIFLTCARMIRYSSAYPSVITTYLGFIFSIIFTSLILWMVYLFITEDKFRNILQNINRDI
ncbi:MAG: glycosyltransferase family 87 protein [Candidatus Thermoplasmatota archaeon]